MGINRTYQYEHIGNYVYFEKLLVECDMRHLDENKSEYVFENVCYKENTGIPIIEESAKLKIAKELVKNNKKVIIRDTMEIITEVKKEFGVIFNYEIM